MNTFIYGRCVSSLYNSRIPSDPCKKVPEGIDRSLKPVDMPAQRKCLTVSELQAWCVLTSP